MQHEKSLACAYIYYGDILHKDKNMIWSCNLPKHKLHISKTHLYDLLFFVVVKDVFVNGTERGSKIMRLPNDVI